MRPKSFLRLALFIVFGFIGAYVARSGTPPEIFAITGAYFMLAAVLAFATLGFILPDVLELAGRAGIAVLARQIAELIQRSGSASLSASRFPFRRKKNSNNSAYVNPLLVDTSSLIDGRILEVVETGFLFGTLLVMPSVIDELHKLSDSADPLKRKKGRRGLDVLAKLKKEKKTKLEILKSDPKEKDVDAKLVALARKLKAKILTVDYNLNKVANIRGIAILNMNELASAVKTAVMPKDVLDIVILEKGRERDQGVGYLPDGTMVVVEKGAPLEGKSTQVEVQRVFQTAAGKMVFAKLAKWVSDIPISNI